MTCNKSFLKQKVKKVILLLPEPLKKRLYPLARKALACYKILKEPDDYSFNLFGESIEDKKYSEVRHQILKELNRISEYAPYVKDVNSPLPPICRRAELRPEGLAFLKLMKTMGSFIPDVVLLIPKLTKGDDSKILNVARALSQVGKKVLIITTGNEPCDCIDGFADKIKLIDFGIFTKNFSFDKKKYLLARFLIQLQPEIVDNLQSSLGFATFYTYHRSLKNYMKLYASFYDDAISQSFAARYIQSLAPALDLLISDQHQIPQKYESIYGISKEKWKILYGYYQSNKNEIFPKKLVLLCVISLEDQELLKLFEEIILKFPTIQFRIYTTSSNDGLQKKRDRFKKFENVTLTGSYTSFTDMNNQEVYAFLCMDEDTVTPNVTIMEAADKGLPIISRSFAEVKELLNVNNLGLSPNNISDFCIAIEKTLKNKDEILNRNVRDKKLAEERHSKEAYLQTLNKIYDIDNF